MDIDLKRVSIEMLERHAGDVFDHQLSKINNCVSNIYYNKDNILKEQDCSTDALKAYIKVFEDKLSEIFKNMELQRGPTMSHVICHSAIFDEIIYDFVTYLAAKGLNVTINEGGMFPGLMIKAYSAQDLVFCFGAESIESCSQFLRNHGFAQIFKHGSNDNQESKNGS